MSTPRKHEILLRAKARAMEKQVRHGLPATTPTESELKESGAFQEARLDLMRVDQEAVSEQMRYLQELAGDLRLAVIPQKAFGVLRKETGYEWTNGWTKHKTAKHRDRIPVKSKPNIGTMVPMKKVRVQIPFQKKRKKRQRLHIARNGKKPRKLKGFVFGDDVWKVRQPRKRGGR